MFSLKCLDFNKVESHPIFYNEEICSSKDHSKMIQEITSAYELLLAQSKINDDRNAINKEFESLGKSSSADYVNFRNL